MYRWTTSKHHNEYRKHHHIQNNNCQIISNNAVQYFGNFLHTESMKVTENIIFWQSKSGTLSSKLHCGNGNIVIMGYYQHPTFLQCNINYQ